MFSISILVISIFIISSALPLFVAKNTSLSVDSLTGASLKWYEKGDIVVISPFRVKKFSYWILIPN